MKLLFIVIALLVILPQITLAFVESTDKLTSKEKGFLVDYSVLGLGNGVGYPCGGSTCVDVRCCCNDECCC